MCTGKYYFNYTLSKDLCEKGCYQKHKRPVVVKPNAIIEPDAMMIEIHGTPIAPSTMLC